MSDYRNTLLIFTLCISGLFLHSCRNNDKSYEEKNQLSYNMDKRWIKITSNDSVLYYGMELKNILNIINIDSFPGNVSSFILLYFSGFDCDPCVLKSFKILEEIQKKNFKTYVVLYDGSVGEVRKKFDYKGYIFLDNDYLLHKQLNHTGTPIIILLDNSFIIRSTFHPDF